MWIRTGVFTEPGFSLIVQENVLVNCSALRPPTDDGGRGQPNIELQRKGLAAVSLKCQIWGNFRCTVNFRFFFPINNSHLK